MPRVVGVQLQDSLKPADGRIVDREDGIRQRERGQDQTAKSQETQCLSSVHFNYQSNTEDAFGLEIIRRHITVTHSHL